MKFYCVVHSHLSTIQKGIQGAHTIAEFCNTYRTNAAVMLQFYDWAKNHKTLIFLEGGNSAALEKLRNNLQNFDLPFSSFYEDEQTLDFLHTSIGVLISENSVYQDIFSNLKLAN